MPKARIALLRTSPARVHDDISPTVKMGRVKQALDLDSVTILKDNIFWYFPFLSANSTPWQIGGTILGLKEEGYQDLFAVHNNIR